MPRRITKNLAVVVASLLLVCTSSTTADATYKPGSKAVLTVAMIVKCKNPNVYSNYSLGWADNWVKVKPYLKGSTYYYGIKFEGRYSVVAVTMGTKSATLQISNNGERFLRYVSGCPSKMSISYNYVNNFSEG